MATHKHTATRSRTLMATGAALVSATAIVAATPALAPNLNPSPTALSSAAYQLSSFADVLKITPSRLVQTYFTGWGGAVNTNNNPAIEPYASGCSTTDGNGNTVGACYVVGLSGIAYLIEDALVNGNGLGPEYAQGGAGIPPWGVSAVNYFYEPAQVGYGISGGLQYLAQSGIDPTNPLYYAITLAFGGPAIVSVAYQTVLNLIAQAVVAIPLVGPVIAGGINSYLNGFPPGNPQTQNGIPGLLAYIANLLTSGTIPTAASTASAPSAAAASRTAAAAAIAPVAAAASTAVSNATRSIGARTASAVAAPVSPAAVAPATEAVAPAPASTEPSATTEPSAQPTVAAQPETPASSAPVAPDLKPAASSTPAPRVAARGADPVKRPVRDAIESAGKQIGSALSGLTAGTS